MTPMGSGASPRAGAVGGMRMRELFGRLPIKHKLLVGMTSFLLLLAGILYYYLPSQQYRYARERVEAEALRVSRLVAAGAATAVDFDDKEAVDRVLSWVKEDPRIRSAVVVNGKGQVVGAYPADAPKTGIDPRIESPRIEVRTDRVEVVTPVIKRAQAEPEPAAEEPAAAAGTGSAEPALTNPFAQPAAAPVVGDTHVGALRMSFSLEDLQAEVDRVRATTLVVCAIVLGLGIVFVVLIGNAIARPLVELTGAATEIGAGKLGTRIEVRSRDEAGELGTAFNHMAAQLEDALASERSAAEKERLARQAVVETSERVATTSTDILATTTQQASGAQEQAAAVTEVVATVNEVTQTADDAARRATGVMESAREAMDAGKAGRQAVDETIAGMRIARQQVEGIASGILALAERAQAIGDIISTVNEIAEQTNLLALNAAIEASRAGEHGRGFSVVATEVKVLANQSKKATAQIRQILGEIQKATNGAVLATEEGTKSVNEAERVVNRAGDTIKTLVATADAAAQAAAQIAASASQQATGMAHIHRAMKNIQDVATQNLGATTQAENAARDLNQLAETLRELVKG